MVNIGLNPGAMLGIVLFGAGAGLYFMRSVRPELARDHDIFFMAVAILSGGILFFQGWRLDPILTFGQFLLTGSAIFFAVESIRLRGLATSQAKRNTPIVDYDRPVSRVYEAELDDFELEDDPQMTRRMIGTREGRNTGVDEYDDDLPRSSTTRRSTSMSLGSATRTTRETSTRTRPGGGSTARRSTSMSDGRATRTTGRTSTRRPRPTKDRRIRDADDWETLKDPYGRSSENDSPRRDRPTASAKGSRRSRPPRSYDAQEQTNYVDFQPVEKRSSDDEDDDNSSGFDY
ncbi:MAG: Ycf66 family protein [Hormoscilla sp. GM7CHS1pb]|nr:Ycf66 family protein [Hormoscilla sp. GM7CHS1pb]